MLGSRRLENSSFFFFNDTATTEIYTLSLHDALPICEGPELHRPEMVCGRQRAAADQRSEEHTSELQSQSNLVCRLLLEKKKNNLTSTSCISMLPESSYSHASM